MEVIIIFLFLLLVLIFIMMTLDMFIANKCYHHYEVIKVIPVQDGELTMYHKYVNRCKNCGKLKIFKT